MSVYHDFQPQKSSRVRESIEWSIRYSYRTEAKDLPRVLLIGDSICNAYHSAVAARLGDDAVITYWASSKCVTDPDYFRELDFVIDGDHGQYAAISFNNGLHSLTTDRAEWNEAYRAVIRYLRAKCPNAKLVLTLCTPSRNPDQNDRVLTINEDTRAAAKEADLPVIDLYGAVADLDWDAFMSDSVHWKSEGVDVQADCIVTNIRELLK